MRRASLLFALVLPLTLTLSAVVENARAEVSLPCALQSSEGSAVAAESLASAVDANDTSAVASSVCRQANASSADNVQALADLSAAASTSDMERVNSTQSAFTQLEEHSAKVDEVATTAAELVALMTSTSSLLSGVNATLSIVKSLEACNASYCSAHASSRVRLPSRRPRIRMAMQDTTCAGVDPDQSGCSRCVVPTNMVMTCEDDKGRALNLSTCYQRGAFASRIVRHLAPTSSNSTTRVFSSAGVSGSCCVSATAGLYNCECATGFNGSDCTTCLSGYFGATCSACPSSDGAVCGGHGTCDDGLTGSGTCTCSTGYSGSSCGVSTTCASMPPSPTELSLFSASTESGGTKIGETGSFSISADSLVLVGGIDMGASGVDVFYRASLSSSFSFIQNLKYGSTVRMGYRRPIVSGDHLVLIVPDIQADIADIDAGALYVYLWDTSADLYVYNSTLTSSEATLQAQLGHSGLYMTYDASRILAPHYTANVPTVGVLANVGGLAVYNWVDGSHYSQVDYVMPTDIAAANLMFGKSAYAASSCVSDDGLWLLASTYGFESNRGIAISYKYNGATYDEMQRIYESDYDSVVRTNSWGFQMACNFNLTVAAISNRAVPFNFYILSRTGDTFSFEQKIAPEGTATSLLGEQSGFVMSPDGYIILVGDYGYNAEEGGAFMYTKDDGSNTYTFDSFIASGHAGSQFGRYMMMASDYSIVSTVVHNGVEQLMHFQCQ